jgi:acetylornithine aminotransferase
MNDQPKINQTGEPEWQDRYSHAMMNAFGMPSRLFDRGLGVHLWDNTGQQYLDLLAGIAVVGLGHAHPKIVQATAEQAA